MKKQPVLLGWLEYFFCNEEGKLFHKRAGELRVVHDKRISKRIAASFPVTVEGVSATWTATATNFGVDGMCYALSKEQAGTLSEQEVFLTFSPIKKLKPVRVMGWIVHRSVNGDTAEIGVTFMFLTPSDEQLLQDYLERHQ